MQRICLGRGQTLKLDRFISSSHFPTHNIFPQHSGKLLSPGDQLTFSPLLSCGGSQHAWLFFTLNWLHLYSNKHHWMKLEYLWKNFVFIISLNGIYYAFFWGVNRGMGKQSWLLCSRCIIYSNNWRWDTLSPAGPARPGFPWGPGAPCTKPDRRKQYQSVIELSINLHGEKELKQTAALLLWSLSGELHRHSTLTCFPIHQLCVHVCVCWVVSEVFGDCIGG